MGEIGHPVVRSPNLRGYGVVLALFILSMITYIDRTSVSTAKDAISAALQLSDRAMGIVFSACRVEWSTACTLRDCGRGRGGSLQ
jgi:sugar phosphate permease